MGKGRADASFVGALLVGCACVVCITGTVLMVMGAISMHAAKELEDDTNQGYCTATSIEPVTCTYQCNCYCCSYYYSSDGTSSCSQCCSTCTGTEMITWATADKCSASNVMRQHRTDAIDGSWCNDGAEHSPGQVFDCWVYKDCSKFSSTSPGEAKAAALGFLIAFGVLYCCCFCCIGFAVCGGTSRFRGMGDEEADVSTWSYGWWIAKAAPVSILGISMFSVFTVVAAAAMDDSLWHRSETATQGNWDSFGLFDSVILSVTNNTGMSKTKVDTLNHSALGNCNTREKLFKTLQAFVIISLCIKGLSTLIPFRSVGLPHNPVWSIRRWWIRIFFGVRVFTLCCDAIAVGVLGSLHRREYCGQKLSGTGQMELAYGSLFIGAVLVVEFLMVCFAAFLAFKQLPEIKEELKKEKAVNPSEPAAAGTDEAPEKPGENTTDMEEKKVTGA